MEILFESNYKDMNLSKFLTSTKLGLPPNILEFAKIVYFVQNMENRSTIFTFILSMQIVRDEILTSGRANLYKNPTKIFSSGLHSVYPLLHYI